MVCWAHYIREDKSGERRKFWGKGDRNKELTRKKEYVFHSTYLFNEPNFLIRISQIFSTALQLHFPCQLGQYRHTEDPFFYLDPRGNFHLLTHRYDFRNGWPYNPNQTEPVLVSGHAWSRDGLNWQFQDEQPYWGQLNFADGSVHNCSTFERPHLIFDPQSGEPTHLLNGISTVWLGPDGHPCSQCGKGQGIDHSCVQCKTSPPLDFTMTLITPLLAE